MLQSQWLLTCTDTHLGTNHKDVQAIAAPQFCSSMALERLSITGDLKSG